MTLKGNFADCAACTGRLHHRRRAMRCGHGIAQCISPFLSPVFPHITMIRQLLGEKKQASDIISTGLKPQNTCMIRVSCPEQIAHFFFLSSLPSLVLLSCLVLSCALLSLLDFLLTASLTHLHIPPHPLALHHPRHEFRILFRSAGKYRWKRANHHPLLGRRPSIQNGSLELHPLYKPFKVYAIPPLSPSQPFHSYLLSIFSLTIYPLPNQVSTRSSFPLSSLPPLCPPSVPSVTVSHKVAWTFKPFRLSSFHSVPLGSSFPSRLFSLCLLPRFLVVVNLRFAVPLCGSPCP